MEALSLVLSLNTVLVRIDGCQLCTGASFFMM